MRRRFCRTTRGRERWRGRLCSAGTELRDQKAADKQRSLRGRLNAVEKGMADVRMLLIVRARPEATQALEHMESGYANCRHEWMEQFAALKKEVRDKKAEVERPGWSPLDGQTAEIPAPFNATGVIQPDSLAAEEMGDGRVTEALPAPIPRVDPAAETAQFVAEDPARDVLYPRDDAGRDVETQVFEKKPEVAPELREFLSRSLRGLGLRWLGIAVAVVVVVLAWVFLRPKPASTGIEDSGGRGLHLRGN